MSNTTPAAERFHLRISAGAWVVVAGFCLSRLVATLAGVRLAAEPLQVFWQVIDPVLLKGDLLRSLWYLHSQPPLFNLFLGVVWKLTGAFHLIAFKSIYLVVGLFIALALYRLARDLGAGQILAAATALIFSVSPGAICYENLLFYTHLEVALLLGSALSLKRFLDTRHWFWGISFFLTLAKLTWLHSIFHLVWLIAAAAALLLLWPKGRRTMLIALAVPLLLVVGLYAKNLALYGQFGVSSWFGLSLGKVTTFGVDEQERKALIDQGVLSPLTLLPPYTRLDYFPPELREHEPTGVPLLDARAKSNSTINFHNIAYIDISRLYRDDALRMMRLRPRRYLHNVGLAWLYYLQPTSSLEANKDNRRRIAGYDRLYDTAIVWHGAAVVFLWTLALIWALATAVRQLRAPDGDRTRAIVLLFLAGNIAYLALVGNTFECGENFRFRFLAEPYAWTLIALTGQWYVRRRKG